MELAEGFSDSRFRQLLRQLRQYGLLSRQHACSGQFRFNYFNEPKLHAAGHAVCFEVIVLGWA